MEGEKRPEGGEPVVHHPLFYFFSRWEVFWLGELYSHSTLVLFHFCCWEVFWLGTSFILFWFYFISVVGKCCGVAIDFSE